MFCARRTVHCRIALRGSWWVSPSSFVGDRSREADRLTKAGLVETILNCSISILNPTLLGQWLERRRKITGEVTVTWCDGVMLGARAFSQARPFDRPMTPAWQAAPTITLGI
jgi:hypothetical protein